MCGHQPDDFVSNLLDRLLRHLHHPKATPPHVDSWYADQLEGFYVSQHVLRRYDVAHAAYANLERGRGERLKRGRLGTWWRVHLAILRERGITLAGPTPPSLIDPISPAVLQQTMVEDLQAWASSKLNDPAQVRPRPAQSYVVLTLCRMLYTLQTGQLVTKRVAARWALATLEARWRPLLERAWVGRHHPAAAQAASGGWEPLNNRMWEGLHDVDVSPEEVNETLTFIRYTIECSQL
jgi:hypothetical protein